MSAIWKMKNYHYYTLTYVCGVTVMDSAIQVQILDKSICISLYSAFQKGINTSLLLPTMGK